MARFLSIHHGLYPLVKRLRARPFVVRALFGVRLPAGAAPSWDTTTLALRLVLARRGRGARSVLELGVGEAALLSIFLARRLGIAVEGVDVSPARVESSRRVAAHNAVSVRVGQSDLFEAVEGRYDLIFSNPPYVPTAAGHALELTARAGFESDRVWDGGEDGTAVLARILSEAPPHLAERGLLLVGVQDFHVPDGVILRRVAEAGFEVVSREKPWFLPSVVWVLRKV